MLKGMSCLNIAVAFMMAGDTQKKCPISAPEKHPTSAIAPDYIPKLLQCCHIGLQLPVQGAASCHAPRQYLPTASPPAPLKVALFLSRHGPTAKAFLLPRGQGDPQPPPRTAAKRTAASPRGWYCLGSSPPGAGAGCGCGEGEGGRRGRRAPRFTIRMHLESNQRPAP